VFLIGVVVFAHHPVVFMGLFLFFLGCRPRLHPPPGPPDPAEGLLVAFFLAGLVVLGGQQQWWLQPLLMSMSSGACSWCHRAHRLHRQRRPDLPRLAGGGPVDDFKYALVAGPSPAAA
jgi:hypothetical protein